MEHELKPHESIPLSVKIMTVLMVASLYAFAIALMIFMIAFKNYFNI